MGKPLSPIERMIDKATGYDPSRPKPKPMTIKLRCPRCKKTMDDGRRGTSDPPEAVLYVIPCPECSVGSKVEEGTFYDKDSKLLTPPRPRKESDDV